MALPHVSRRVHARCHLKRPDDIESGLAQLGHFCVTVALAISKAFWSPQPPLVVQPIEPADDEAPSHGPRLEADVDVVTKERRQSLFVETICGGQVG